MKITPLSSAEETVFDIGFFVGAATSLVMVIMFTALNPAMLIIALLLVLAALRQFGKREGWNI